MGYGYYIREHAITGKMIRRGYYIQGVCHDRHCHEKIDRGLAYLCYRCSDYFCGKHLMYSDYPQSCFAGEGKQVCDECYDIIEIEHAHENDEELQNVL